MRTPHILRLAWFCVCALAVSSCSTTPQAPLPAGQGTTAYDTNVLHCDRFQFEPGVYPAEALRLGLSGRVSLAYSVDASGKARDLSVIHSAGRILDDKAVRALKLCRFEVPLGWVASNGPSKRYRFGVTFNIIGRTDVPADADDHPTIAITGTPIQGR